MPHSLCGTPSVAPRFFKQPCPPADVLSQCRAGTSMVHLYGRRSGRTVLCVSILSSSCRYGASFLSGLTSGGLHQRGSSCLCYPKPSCGIGEVARFSRLGVLRGGAQDAEVLVASNSDRSGEGIEVVGTEAVDTKKKEGWLLRVSEHDRQISALALPALLSLLVDPILSLVDTAYVGRGLGAMSLAALGPCTSIFHFSFNTFRSLTQSTTALVGKSLAAGDEKQAGQIVQQMYVIAIVLGASLQVALLTQTPAILSLMGAGPKTLLFGEASGYLQVRALAAPAVLLIMVSEGVFRGHSNTRAPAVAALSAAAANIVLDPILMFTLSMGVAGAAGATALAQYLAVAIYGSMLWAGARRGKMAVPFFDRSSSRGKTAIDGGKQTMAAAVPVGDEISSSEGAEGKSASAAGAWWSLLGTVVSANAAMLLRTTSLMACWAVATAVATRMSSAAVGAHQVTLSLWLLFALVAEAPSIAAQVLGARYIAQGNLETARSMARRVCAITLACSGFLATLLLSLSGVIPRAFTSDPEVLRRLFRLLPLLALQQPLVAMTLVAEGLLVGAGQFRWLGATTVGTSAVAAWFIVLVGRRRAEWGVVGIWGGITAMFVGRLLAAAWRVMDRKRGPYWVLPPSSRAHDTKIDARR